ncbi:MAG: acylphosphatase [Planctomycetota bacterium]|nr:acylphosphatase [Planctomycetota bacterium]
METKERVPGTGGRSGKCRVEVIYDGYVQGVGFRATACSVAAGLAVLGYVKNRWDGTVELVAEGEREEVEKLLSGIRARMRRHIRDEKFSWGLARGEFSDFEVRY